MHSEQFLSLREVIHRLGLSQATIWRMRRDGTFPPATHLSPRRIGWLLSSLEAWEDAQTDKGGECD